MPYMSFHFFVLPGKIPANSPRALFAKWKLLSVSTAPSHRSLSKLSGASPHRDRRRRARRCARPAPSNRRYVPVLGRDKNNVAERAWASLCTGRSGSECADLLRLADETAAPGKFGRDVRLNEPCVSVEEETRKPARIKARYSSGSKMPCESAEWVPMRLSMSRNFSAID